MIVLHLCLSVGRVLHGFFRNLPVSCLRLLRARFCGGSKVAQNFDQRQRAFYDTEFGLRILGRKYRLGATFVL